MHHPTGYQRNIREEQVRHFRRVYNEIKFRKFRTLGSRNRDATHWARGLQVPAPMGCYSDALS